LRRVNLAMPILLVQIPTAVPSMNVRFPDRDDSQILEHLVYYCSKFDPLPVIEIKVEGASAIVVRRHKYLVAARTLGRAQIRAAITSPPSSPEVRAFLARKDVRRLDWEAIKAAEDADRTPHGWHVFFFERSLSAEEKRDLEGRVARLFASVEGGAAIRMHHDDERKLAEFEAHVPVTDHAWVTEHLATFTEFSRGRVRIVSFQGREFAG
jgi:hypothetical protein